MKFTQVFAIFSVFAMAFAVPTVEIDAVFETLEARTDGGVSCTQANSVAACCKNTATGKPTSQFLQEYAPSFAAGLLGILQGVLGAVVPFVVPTITAGVQCVAVNLNLCAAPNVCCLQNSNGVAPNAGLIQVLSGDNLVLCPAVTL